MTTRCLSAILGVLLFGAAALGAVSAADRALLPIPEPELRGTEPEVRDTVTAARANLDAIAANRDTTDTELGEAYGTLAGTYQVHYLYTPAEPCYKNAATLQPDDFRWPYYLGYLYLETNRPADAVPAFERALELRPGDALSQLRLATAYLELNQAEQAAALLEAPLQVRELRAAALYRMGKVALTRREYEQAATMFKEVLAEQPEAARAHYPLAMAYRGMGEVAMARKHLAKHGEGEPVVPDPLVAELDTLLSGARPHYYRAMEAIEVRDFEAASDSFSRALRLEPDNINARVSWARSLYLIGKTEEASAQLEEVLGRDPDQPLAVFLTGVLRDAEGDSEQAMAWYRRTLALEPDHAGANYYLANMLMATGDAAAAARLYRAVRQRETGNLYAWLLEAVALVRAGAPQTEARDVLQLALEAHPETPVFMYALARLLAASPDAAARDGNKARALAEKLYDQSPVPENAEVLAMAHAELGDFEQAITLQNDALGASLAWQRMDLLPRLNENLALYENKQPCRTPWFEEDRIFQAPPMDATGPFRDYPAASVF